MRKLIAAMKMSVDGMIEGSEGMADWAEAWSDDYGLMPQVDACVLGARMYEGYEQYWSAIQNDPETPVWIHGNPPTPAEIEWANFITETPHYVLSSTLDSAQWSNTSFLRGADEVAALKEDSGKDIYLMGGAGTVASMADAGLLDEIRLLVYPLLVGEGKALFATLQQRRGLELQEVEQRDNGLVALTYSIE